MSDTYLEIKIENKELTTSLVLNAHAHLGARYIMKELTFFCDLWHPSHFLFEHNSNAEIERRLNLRDRIGTIPPDQSTL